MQPTQKGYISFLFVGIILFAIILATGFTNNPNFSQSGIKYILATPTPYPSSGTIQLHSLSFNVITPTSTSSTPNTKTSTNTSPTPSPVFACAGSVACQCISPHASLVSCQLYNDCPTSTFFRTTFAGGLTGEGCTFNDSSGLVLYVNDPACNISCP